MCSNAAFLSSKHGDSWLDTALLPCYIYEQLHQPRRWHDPLSAIHDVPKRSASPEPNCVTAQANSISFIPHDFDLGLVRERTNR